MRPSSVGRWLLTSTLLWAVACDPPCKRTCRKVLDCGNLSSDRLAIDACEQDCNRQEELYDQWDDEEKQDLFKEHKRCLLDATCDEIAEGVCYVGYEDLFHFEPAQPASATQTTESSTAGTLDE